MKESLIKRLSHAPEVIVPTSRDTPIILRWATPFEQDTIVISHCKQTISGSESTLGQASRSASRSGLDIHLEHGREATEYLVRFDEASAFRLLDPRDTLSYWEVRAGIPRHQPEKTANSFFVENAPWSRECPLLFRDVALGGATHFVITDARCVVEVISDSPPEIQQIDPTPDQP